MRTILTAAASTLLRPPSAPPNSMEQDASRQPSVEKPDEPSTTSGAAVAASPVLTSSRTDAVASSPQSAAPSSSPPSPSPSQRQPTRRCVSVPRDAVGFIIGKRGETVRNMMQKSRAFIAVDRADTDPHAPYRLFHIEGDRAAVSAARALIREKVAGVLHGSPNAKVHDAAARSIVVGQRWGGAEGGKSSGDAGPTSTTDASGSTEDDVGPAGDARDKSSYGEGSIDDAADDDETPLTAPVEMWIPRGCVGMIIGHGGQVINEMQERAGATIVVHNNKMDRSGAKLLTISGGDSEKQHARELIQNVLDRAGLRNRFRDPAAHSVPPHALPRHDPPAWAFAPPQHALPQPAVRGGQWYFPHVPPPLGFDPRQQIPDFVRMQPMQGGGIPPWMHAMPVQAHPGPSPIPGGVPQSPVGEEQQQAPLRTPPTTPPTPLQGQQQTSGSLLPSMQQQVQHQDFLHMQQQHLQPHNLQQHHLQQHPLHQDHHLQRQTQLRHDQTQQLLQLQEQQQQHSQLHRSSLNPHVQRAANVAGPLMASHVNPMYSQQHGASGSHAGWNRGGQPVGYPMLPQMQGAYEQTGTILPHPMLKLATKTVLVPSSCVGIVIGRSGETIRDLQQRSGAHIKVTPDRDAKEEAQLRVIYISGTPAALELAHSLVNDVINEGLTRNYRDGVEPRSNAEAQEYDVEDAVEDTQQDEGQENVEGKVPQSESEGGSSKSGSSGSRKNGEHPGGAGDEGATIDYTDPSTFPELGTAQQHAGQSSPSTANEARDDITEGDAEEGDTEREDQRELRSVKGQSGDNKAEDDEGEGQGGEEDDGAPLLFTGEGRLVQRPATNYPSASISFEMKIPHAKVGVIIGKRGATIRALQQKSGARIVVSKKIDTSREDNPRAVTITGPEAFVDVARRLIVAKINPPIGDALRPEDRDAGLDAFDFEEGGYVDDNAAIDSLSLELASQSLTNAGPSVMSDSRAPMSPHAVAHSPAYVPYQRALQFFPSNQPVPFSAIPQYPNVRSVLRTEPQEYHPMDRSSQPHAQFSPQFVGAQPYAGNVPLPPSFPFAAGPEVRDAGAGSVPQYFAEQYFPSDAGQEYFEETRYEYGGDYDGAGSDL